MIETLRIDQWLYELLSSDSVLAGLVGSRIYGGLAPQGTALPFVVYSYQAGHDVLGVGTARIMLSCTYVVQAVGRGGSYVPLRPIADRLDGLLQGASGVVVDGRVLACVREEPIQYIEVDDGVEYRHLGGRWRIIAQAIAS